MEKFAQRRFLFSAFLSMGLFISLSLAIPNSVSAQDLDNVTITGKVVDQNGAVIPGATVEAILVKTSAARKVVADAAGSFHIVQLEPGIYNLRATSTGFEPQE